MSRPSPIVMMLAMLGSACTKPPSPNLDEVLDELAELSNRAGTANCQCFELIAGGLYTSEQECLDAIASVEVENLACMKDALAEITRDEQEAVVLIECYNAAEEAQADCLETNVGVCSADTFGDCAAAWTSAVEPCQVGYPEDALETLWYCRF